MKDKILVKRTNIIKKEYLTLLIILAILPMAIAEENQTTNATNMSNVTLTMTPTVTPTVTSTVTSTVTPTVTEKAVFRVGPTVRLRPVNDIIDKSTDGLVEIYLNNPSLNNVTLNFDVEISAPSGIHIYGQGYALAGAAGTVSGIFEVPPGKVRTIFLNIKAEKTGDFTIQFSGLYWPGNNKEDYQPISLTYSIKVKEPSPDPLSSELTNSKQMSPQPTSTPSVDGKWTILSIIAIVVTIAFRKRIIR